MKTQNTEKSTSITVPKHTFPDGEDVILPRRTKRAIKRALNPKKNRKW